MGEQARAARARVRDGHEGLGGPHGGRGVGLVGLFPGALVQNLDHGILLNDLSMEILYSGTGVKRGGGGE